MFRLFLIVFFITSTLSAQTEESDLRLFGYFQIQFVDQKDVREDTRSNSFTLQQLNIIAQKDLAAHWTAFINLEAVNNFSLERQWGSFNLEEAWLRYRYDNRFNLKLGLQIPVFNNLNEIKNRTPLLPYIVKPLAYESSFSEIIPIEEYTPRRAFIQTFGFFSIADTKLDYAFYLGNSPNVETLSGNYISGLDTTDTFLYGGRLGLRYSTVKAGVSASVDQTYSIFQIVSEFYGLELNQRLTTRYRYGMDLSLEIKKFDIEGEYISVIYDDDNKDVVLDKIFYYGTLGYHLNEEFFAYGSYWYIDENLLPAAEFKYAVSSFGMSYNFNYRTTFKLQLSHVDFMPDIKPGNTISFDVNEDFLYTSLAISVFF